MRKTIVLDTNLLVLLMVGLTDRAYVLQHKRLKEFDLDALDALISMLKMSDLLLVTPNTPSEASNLLRYISDPAKSAIARTFSTFIQTTKEIYVKSTDAALRTEFLRLGLADAALLEVAKDEVVILSVDLDLCVAAESAGYKAVNFNHVREAQYSTQGSEWG